MCSSDLSTDSIPTESTDASTTSTTAAPAVVAPLTGLPTSDTALATRKAVVVKIDGHPGAKRQFGLDRADIVIEEIVEGITRYMAVFHSDVPAVVGPIRSARTQDMLIVPMLDRPLFVWSGGNRKVTNLVRKSPVVNLSATTGWRLKGIWFRTKKRRAPHNLLARGPGLLAQMPVASKQPRPLFAYRRADDAAVGREVSGVKISMSSTRVQWLWDATSATWQRSVYNKAHFSDAGVRVAVDNVVILEVKYRSSAADRRSPEAQTMGSGKALVLTGGRLVQGTWRRSDPKQPWTLTDTSGQAILLAPGRTWVELAKSSRSAVIESASEQPAAASGMSTVLAGLRIFAVSAMKCTPQKTMTDASTWAATRDSASESPTWSAMSWISDTW